MFRLPIIGQIPVSSAMNTNIKDLGNDYQLEIELPGYDKKDITASLNKGYLTISATKEEYKNLSDKRIITSEENTIVEAVREVSM